MFYTWTHSSSPGERNFHILNIIIVVVVVSGGDGGGDIIIIIIIIIIHSFLKIFFTSVLADAFSLEFERQQVSSSLQDPSQYSGRSQ